jgi:hypothetical protein
VQNSGKQHGHAPLGNDGIVSSINGTTIIMAEEADEGGASYTIDASTATVTKDGATSDLSSIEVGDKVFVDGTVSGNTVMAKSISNGPKGHGFLGQDKPDAKDANGNDIETNDDSSGN